MTMKNVTAAFALALALAPASLSHAWWGDIPIWYPSNICVQVADGKESVSVNSSIEACKGKFYPGLSYYYRNKQPF